MRGFLAKKQNAKLLLARPLRPKTFNKEKPLDSFFSQEELLQIGFKSVGVHVKVSRKASIYGAEKMSLGNHVRIDDFCYLSGNISIGNYVHIVTASLLYGGTGGITFGDFSTTSPRVTIIADSDDYSGEHMTNPLVPSQYTHHVPQYVHIGKHVIIGSGSTILPDVTLADGTAIGAMSLVSKSTEPFMIYVGCPCKPVKPRSRKLLELEKQMLEET
jgi:galactoside O-acetyltransferase